MTELIIGLLGSGVAVQLFNALATVRQNRRQMNATALGTEVEALERTIAVISSNFEREVERHRRETEQLRARIAELEAKLEELR